MDKVRSFSELATYKRAFDFQQSVFGLTKWWPREETYALTDQIRRSSRSIGANLAEAWAKRRYPAHFLSKLTDADGEIQETAHWLESANACGYLTPEQYVACSAKLNDTRKLLGAMIAQYP